VDEYEKTFNVNVKVSHSIFRFCIKCLLDATQPIFLSAFIFAPFMLEQGHGVFINITRYLYLVQQPYKQLITHAFSTGFTRPRPGFAIYNASKAAVTVFIEVVPRDRL
jgi:NAD(P)-dependent dehydrogenase (short-subunit alcohol dehydrogenase family)